MGLSLQDTDPTDTRCFFAGAARAHTSVCTGLLTPTFPLKQGPNQLCPSGRPVTVTCPRGWAAAGHRGGPGHHPPGVSSACLRGWGSGMGQRPSNLRHSLVQCSAQAGEAVHPGRPPHRPEPRWRPAADNLLLQTHCGGAERRGGGKVSPWGFLAWDLGEWGNKTE